MAPRISAGTFGGNNIACAGRIIVPDIVKEEEFDDCITKMEVCLLKRLKKLKTHHEIIGDIRGIGVISTIELVHNRATKESAVHERNIPP